MFQQPRRSAFSANEPQLLNLALLLTAAAGGVDAGGVDAAVAEDVREAHHVLIPFIIGNGKQMPQIVREHLFGLDLRGQGQFFEHPPDIAAVNRAAGTGDEDLARVDALFFAVRKQLVAERTRQQDLAGLALHTDLRLPPARRLYGNAPQLGDTNTGGGNRLHQQGQTFIALLASGFHQTLIFPGRKLLFRAAEGLALDLQKPKLPFIAAHIFKVLVHRRQKGIDADIRIALLDEMLFERDKGGFVGDLLAGKTAKLFEITPILLDGAGAALLQGKIAGKFSHGFHCKLQTHTNTPTQFCLYHTKLCGGLSFS